MSCLSNFPNVEVLSPEDMPRRRHRSDEAKLRIVEESFEGVRQGSATARRYGVSGSLLSLWRRAYREGTLCEGANQDTFVQLVPESPAPVQPETDDNRSDGTIEITLANGRRLTAPASIAPATLAGLLSVVDPQ
jgi:transposase